MKEINIIEEAVNVFDIEINSLEIVKENLDKRFEKIVSLINDCQGKVIFTGMGKSGHIAKKLAATFASLGTPSFCLHPAEALHGDLGMISKSDIVIAISFSGESEEIIRILPNIKKIGATIIGISGNNNSTLIKKSDYSYVLPHIEEACYMKLAPTSSTTSVLVLGDALAVCCAKLKLFNKNDFALFHPAGSLGKCLITKVEDIMKTDKENSMILYNANFKDALAEMCKTTLGMVSIVDENNKLIGIFTDGDLRRKMASEVNLFEMELKDIITTTPVVLRKDMLAVEALRLMINGNKKISVAPVVEDGKLIGAIKAEDIIKLGISL